MISDPDSIIDRRRLKRRLNFWRVLGVLAVIAALAAAVGRFGDDGGFTDYVVRLRIDGIILNDPVVLEALDDAAKDDRARALILDINSPGGTVVGGEGLYRAIRDVAEKKPVVAVMGDTATSAAYMAAIAADRIFAHAGTVTGSIGVIMQTADVTAMLEKLGIKPETVKSGELKAQPNPMESFGPEARQVSQAVVADLHAMFVDMVRERRGLSEAQMQELADGRIFSGRQALDVGLVDAIGREKDAVQWLAETHGIETEPTIVDAIEPEEDELWRDLVSGMVGKVLFSERLRLDGMISLWHPGLR